MIGRAVGNYRIVSLIGTGGMGSVYLAEHPYMGRKVAIKVLRGEYVTQTDVVRRFLNEARTASAIRHPNIVEMLDTGTLDDGTPYLVMEYLDGESLGTRLRRQGRLSLPIAVDIAEQSASALAAAHGRGVIHRDLKPDNLFLMREARTLPGRERVKVLDFGVAKRQHDATSVRTATGTLIGTPLYMSPEQCRGVRDVDGRSDIYMLGAIIYEMICGAPPFVSEGFGELVMMHLHEPPVPPRQKNADVPMVLESVVLRALAKEPEARFQDCGELQAALAGCQTAIAAQQAAQQSASTLPDSAGLLSSEVLATVKDATLPSLPAAAPAPPGPGVDQRFVATMRLFGSRRLAMVAIGLGVALAISLVVILILTASPRAVRDPLAPVLGPSPELRPAGRATVPPAGPERQPLGAGAPDAGALPPRTTVLPPVIVPPANVSPRPAPAAPEHKVKPRKGAPTTTEEEPYKL